MKRILSLIMVCVLALSLAGCGCGKDATPYSMGTITGNKYENTLLGMGVNFTEEWTLTSQGDIALLNGLDSSLNKESLEAELAKIDSATVFVADHYESGNSFNINMQKLSSLENILVGIGAKDEDYIDEVVKELVDTMPEAMAEEGMTISDIHATEVSVGGTMIDAIDMDCRYDDYNLDYYMRQILLVKDGYMAAVTITAFEKEDLEEITSYIYMI